MTNDPRSDDPFRPAAPAPAAAADPFAPHQAPVAPTPPAPLPPPESARPSRAGGASLFVNLLLGLAAVVAVGGVAFAIGRTTAPTALAPNGNLGRFGNGGGPISIGPNASGAPGDGGFVSQGGFGGGGLSIEGKVTAVSADSITIQLASGQTVTIPRNARTAYRVSQAATSADVTSGSTVQVQLEGGRGAFGPGNGNGGPDPSGQPRTTPAARSITVLPAGS